MVHGFSGARLRIALIAPIADHGDRVLVKRRRVTHGVFEQFIGLNLIGRSTPQVLQHFVEQASTSGWLIGR